MLVLLHTALTTVCQVKNIDRVLLVCHKHPVNLWILQLNQLVQCFEHFLFILILELRLLLSELHKLFLLSLHLRLHSSHVATREFFHDNLVGHMLR